MDDSNEARGVRGTALGKFWRWYNAPAAGSLRSWPNFARALARAMPPVAINYALAAYLAPQLHLNEGSAPPTWVMANVVLPILVVVLTASHGLLAGYAYGWFARPIREATDAGQKVPGVFRVFIAGHMASFFGIPILFWTLIAGPWSLAPLVLQLGLGPRGTRQWSLLVHGSNALALAMFVGTTQSAHTAPGIQAAIIVGQAVILALIDLLVRPAFIPNDASPSRAPPGRARAAA